MNFDTRYLIRWGIPGWIFIIFSSVYFLIRDFEGMKDLFPKGSGTSIVAAGAIITVLGIPIGYLFNQIHHTVTFVWFRKWDKYFKYETEFENYMFTYKTLSKTDSNVGEKLQERYRYLLSRIHEIGSICFAIIYSQFINIYWEYTNKIKMNNFAWVFHIIVFIVLVIMFIDRWYYKRNIEVFANFHSEKAGIKKYYKT